MIKVPGSKPDVFPTWQCAMSCSKHDIDNVEAENYSLWRT